MKQFLCSILLLFSVTGYSQILVNGKVTNLATGEPVPFVNIIITELGKGTVSNLDGDFNFRLPADIQDNMEVVFSHIGYESTKIYVKDLKNPPIQVKIIPSEYELDQAIVLDFHPKRIMELAKENLVNTQYVKAHEIEVFYRELIWANDTIQGLTRAEGYMHSEGYHKKHSRKPNTSGDNYSFMAISNIQKTEYGVLTTRTGRPRGAIGNFIFPSLPYRLWDFKLNWFEYELLGGKKIGDRQVYVLAITAKDDGVKSSASRWGYSLYGLLEDAIIYIDQEDYGIHMMELKQKFPPEREMDDKVGQVYLQKEREAVVKFRRDSDGKYLFTYGNYQMTYTDFGYQTEQNPITREVKEYAELYAMDYSMEILDNQQLSEKYQAHVAGVYSDRSINYHTDLYNGWIFISGKARYHPSFWENFDYPSFPGEKQLEATLSQAKPLEEQFAEFRNNQFYLYPILKKRHGVKEYVWDRSGLYQHPAKY
ncbi:CarboxypepD_reg-like domain-containing protein [Algoriphagus locisalis]|uniref:CarboxypepD_reg-like domain-containing protein n=1 Tax=Algoriphagus locisalis TaxID=305507 RepID=A0A1I7AJJ8_9BACT|nr:carboxypeptidase-like regulatory domain-containing protein [Algoriphagus locisalis]SFT75106.1 CarboxypepD_reg-like domain-containing protein [Algoriphagus locisalis]